jgi:hypothetical protein
VALKETPPTLTLTLIVSPPGAIARAEAVSPPGLRVSVAGVESDHVGGLSGVGATSMGFPF